MITIIAAIDDERGIGLNGKLPWDVPEDVAFFKKMTTNEIVVMGRKTWDSLTDEIKPLPDRVNIIITHSKSGTFSKLHFCQNIDDIAPIIKHNRDYQHKEIFIIGGESIYKQFIDRADKLVLTLIPGTHNADAFFPEYETDWYERACFSIAPEIWVKSFTRRPLLRHDHE